MAFAINEKSSNINEIIKMITAQRRGEEETGAEINYRL